MEKFGGKYFLKTFGKMTHPKLTSWLAGQNFANLNLFRLISVVSLFQNQKKNHDLFFDRDSNHFKLYSSIYSYHTLYSRCQSPKYENGF